MAIAYEFLIVHKKNIDEEHISAATSIMSTIQQVAQSFGVALAAILVSIFSYELSPDHMFTSSIFHHTFVVMGILTLFSGLIFIGLKKEDGRELIE